MAESDLCFDFTEDEPGNAYGVTAAQNKDVATLLGTAQSLSLTLSSITPDAAALQPLVPWLVPPVRCLARHDERQWLWATKRAGGDEVWRRPIPSHNWPHCLGWQLTKSRFAARRKANLIVGRLFRGASLRCPKPGPAMPLLSGWRLPGGADVAVSQLFTPGDGAGGSTLRGYGRQLLRARHSCWLLAVRSGAVLSRAIFIRRQSGDNQTKTYWRR